MHRLHNSSEDYFNDRLLTLIVNNNNVKFIYPSLLNHLHLPDFIDNLVK
jgi:hypothetical protein